MPVRPAAGKEPTDPSCRAAGSRLASRRVTEAGSASTVAAPAVTVVVCTYRRPACLRHALESLGRQTWSAEAFDVIVVNNAPDDHRVDDVVGAIRHAHFAAAPSRLRLVPCAAPGLSHARNAGLAAARGAIVAFLDDDALAAPTWLEAVERTFAAHPRAGVVGGTIRLEPPSPVPRWLRPGWEHYWSHLIIAGDGPRPARDWTEYPWGANWSARRQPLLDAGGFSPDYGRTGDDFAGGEEIVAAAALQQRGWEILLVPEAVVVHRPPANRYMLRHVWERIRSARREEYRQRRDGHLGPAMRTGDVLADALRAGATAVRPRTAGWHQRLEALMRAAATLALLPRLARDRRPS
jgi:glycosyltransferase involved in cell wall biosynthesis